MDDASMPAPDIPGPQREIYSVDFSHVEFATFYQAEFPRLVRSLIKSGASGQDATEAAQNAFAQLFEQWDKVISPKAWLRKVSFRMFLRQREKNEHSRLEDDQAGALSSSTCVELREEELTVLSALHQLPPAQRQVFALHYDKFETREIAEILDMKEDAVRQNLARARTGLKKHLGLTQ